MSVTYTSTSGEVSTLVVAELTAVSVVPGDPAIVVDNTEGASLDADGDMTLLAESGVVVFSGYLYGQYTEFYPAGTAMSPFETVLTEG